MDKIVQPVKDLFGHLPQNAKVIAIVVVFAVVVLMMMSGRRVRYFCRTCGHTWKGTKHHGGTAPSCPKCGSTDVGRK